MDKLDGTPNYHKDEEDNLEDIFFFFLTLSVLCMPDREHDDLDEALVTSK